MTLTDAAEFTKKAKYFVGIPVVVIFVVWAVASMLRPQIDLPANYVTPDYMCGKIAPIDLTNIGMTSPRATFSIETRSGAIPDLPRVVNVFEYIHEPSLTALQEAQYIAEKLGFDKERYSRRSVTEYEWVDQMTYKTLTIETGNMNFHLTTDFAQADISTGGSLPSEENAKTVASQYLQKTGLMTKDFRDGYQRSYKVRVTAGGEFEEAASLSEAHLIRVDFFRQRDLITIAPHLTGSQEFGALQQELEQQKATKSPTGTAVKTYTTHIVGESPIFGNISVYIGSSIPARPNEYPVYKIDYTNWIIDESPCGTYRLVSPQEAIRQIQEGNARLMYLLPKGKDRIKTPIQQEVKRMMILDVSIVYLDLKTKQSFMQPVFQIKGEAEFANGDFGEFFYYVPAIDYESIPDNAGIVPYSENSN